MHLPQRKSLLRYPSNILNYYCMQFRFLLFFAFFKDFAFYQWLIYFAFSFYCLRYHHHLNKQVQEILNQIITRKYKIPTGSINIKQILVLFQLISVNKLQNTSFFSALLFPILQFVFNFHFISKIQNFSHSLNVFFFVSKQIINIIIHFFSYFTIYFVFI